MRLALTLLLIAMTALTACGGDAAVPDDYASTSQFGATFKLPPTLKAGAPVQAQESRTVSYTGSDAVSASLRFAPGRGPAFATFPDQQRAALSALGTGEVDGQRSVEVPGADDAYLLTATQQAQGGGTVDVASVGARKGADVWVLTAYVKQGGDADAEAIARSLRVGDG